MPDRITAWADARRDIALDLIRIYLGVGLFARGVVFLNDSGAIVELAGADGSELSSVALAHYVGLAHLGGGLLLAVGMITRVAALLQIPVLFGATFIIHFPESFFAANQSFAFSALVLALLCVYAVWGGGRWSLDRAIARWNSETEEREAQIVENRLQDRRERARERRRRLAAERAMTPRPSEEPEPQRCIHGYDRDDPRVLAERTYSPLSGLRFVFGTHPRPRSVTFRCKECGGVVEVATDPEEMETYRFVR
ncbi:MAG: DoxX family protein [Bacteroidota bacterium]